MVKVVLIEFISETYIHDIRVVTYTSRPRASGSSPFKTVSAFTFSVASYNTRALPHRAHSKRLAPASRTTRGTFRSTFYSRTSFTFALVAANNIVYARRARPWPIMQAHDERDPCVTQPGNHVCGAFVAMMPGYRLSAVTGSRAQSTVMYIDRAINLWKGLYPGCSAAKVLCDQCRVTWRQCIVSA